MGSEVVSYGDLIMLLGKKDVELLEREKIIEALQGELKQLDETVKNLQKEIDNVNGRRASRKRS